MFRNKNGSTSRYLTILPNEDTDEAVKRYQEDGWIIIRYIVEGDRLIAKATGTSNGNDEFDAKPKKTGKEKEEKKDTEEAA